MHHLSPHHLSSELATVVLGSADDQATFHKQTFHCWVRFPENQKQWPRCLAGRHGFAPSRLSRLSARAKDRLPRPAQRCCQSRPGQVGALLLVSQTNYATFQPQHMLASHQYLQQSLAVGSGHGHGDVTHAGLTLHKPGQWHRIATEVATGTMWYATVLEAPVDSMGHPLQLKLISSNCRFWLFVRFYHDGEGLFVSAPSLSMYLEPIPHMTVAGSIYCLAPQPCWSAS